MRRIAVIGGDLRLWYVSEQLKKEGKEVSLFGTYKVGPCTKRGLPFTELSDRLAHTQLVVLGLPMLKKDRLINLGADDYKLGLGDLLPLIPKEAPVLAGMVSEETMAEAAAFGLTVIDYFLREELTVLNAVPTAEGAVQAAMENTPFTLHGSRVLVTGFGRVSKVLCRTLQALGAHVTVAVRKKTDAAWIEAMGYEPAMTDQLPLLVPVSDIIYNTVPAPLFSAELLAGMKEDSVLIDLASLPGGVDFESARRLKKNVISALSLPGKVAPMTAGKLIKTAISHCLEERGSRL